MYFNLVVLQEPHERRPSEPARQTAASASSEGLGRIQTAPGPAGYSGQSLNLRGC